MLKTCWEIRAEVPLSNVTPIWLLPYMRLIKGEAKGCYAKAWKALPDHLPRGVKCPSMEAVAIVLVDHNLI